MAALQAVRTLPKDANWASVTLFTNGQPDELMAVAASYDKTLQYGAQTPFSDQLSFRWEGGMWQYDAYHDSIITVGNGGTRPTQTAFTIFYNQGAQRYDLEQTLQPDAQMWIDIGKLISEHVPDKNGNLLPPGVTSGSYEFRDLTDIGVGSLFEGKLTYDKTYGHAVYGCAECCGYGETVPWYNPIPVPVLLEAADGVNGLSSCTGTMVDVSGAFYNNWSSANTAIATVDAYGTHTGKVEGSTTSQTYGLLDLPRARLCPANQRTDGGGVNVNPLTPSQHTYPNPPLAGCRISVPFDAIISLKGKKHQAQDTVASGVQVGTPVFAPEAGTITNFVSGKPHDPRPALQCAGQNSPADFIEIRSDSDQALTRLYHVTILPNLATIGTHVTGGQQIGTIDLSGCTSNPHTHIQRKVGGVLVNFTMPCDNSHFDDPSTYYDDSDGTW